ncbi:hypothetical protein HMPREF9554_00048 [Treponema phagedenis F0421]|nr:hypothetical protein HMPREF9554_00048 [Treponema phagedenis F0421]
MLYTIAFLTITKNNLHRENHACTASESDLQDKSEVLEIHSNFATLKRDSKDGSTLCVLFFCIQHIHEKNNYHYTVKSKIGKTL